MSSRRENRPQNGIPTDRYTNQAAVRFCVSLNKVSFHNAAAALGGAERPILGEAAEDGCMYTAAVRGVVCIYIHTYIAAVQITAPDVGPSAQPVRSDTTFGCYI
jgi:hypothetical protein